MDGLLQIAEPKSDTEIEIKLPKTNINGGGFNTIKISTNKNNFITFSLLSNIDIEICPEGTICDLVSSSQCLPGEICPSS